MQSIRASLPARKSGGRTSYKGMVTTGSKETKRVEPPPPVDPDEIAETIRVVYKPTRKPGGRTSYKGAAIASKRETKKVEPLPSTDPEEVAKSMREAFKSIRRPGRQASHGRMVTKGRRGVAYG